jgi:cytochrome b subunit of formate dehydrogenase
MLLEAATCPLFVDIIKPHFLLKIHEIVTPKVYKNYCGYTDVALAARFLIFISIYISKRLFTPENRFRTCPAAFSFCAVSFQQCGVLV